MSCCISSLSGCCTPIASFLSAGAQKVGLCALMGAVQEVATPILGGFGGACGAFLGLSLCLKIGVVVTTILAIGLAARVASCCFTGCAQAAPAQGRTDVVTPPSEGRE